MQAAATCSPDGVAAKLKLNNNLARSPRAAASAVALEATAAKSKSGRQAITDLWGNLSSNPLAATSEVRLHLAASNSAQGGDGIARLYQRMAGDPKGAAAARQLLDSASDSQEGRAPAEQLRRVIDQRVAQGPLQPEEQPPQERETVEKPSAGQLTESEQNQRAQEQSEEAVSEA